MHTFANSEEADEITYNVTFHQGLTNMIFREKILINCALFVKFLKNERYKTYKMGFNNPGGQTFIFSKHGHVAYQNK